MNKWSCVEFVIKTTSPYKYSIFQKKRQNHNAYVKTSKLRGRLKLGTIIMYFEMILRNQELWKFSWQKFIKNTVIQ